MSRRSGEAGIRWMGTTAASRTCAALCAVALVVLTAAPASAATGSYTIASSGGATFTLLSSNNLFPGGVDDDTVVLSVNGTGAARLPFRIRIYGTLKPAMAVSSNGNIQFNLASRSAAFTNDCLPSQVLPSQKVVAPFWDDLFFNAAEGEGVFTQTKGAAPNRRFVVSWQGHLFSSTGTVVLAQVVFFENSQTIRMIYGRNGGGSATVGVQASSVGPSTQYVCNSGLTPIVQGLRLDFLHHN